MQFFGFRRASGNVVKRYRVIDELGQPAPRVEMPRALNIVRPTAIGTGTGGRRGSGETLMSNHVHLLLQAPTHDALVPPLRWFLTETARAFHRARGRRGHCWERRYRACLVEEDLYALAALRYLDRNPVRAGLVEDPTTYPWSSCAAYARGTPNRVVMLHPSNLALSASAKGRRRHYRALLAPE